MQNFKHRSERSTYRVFIDKPVLLGLPGEGSQSAWRFQNGDLQEPYCMGCIDEPCRKITAAPNVSRIFDNFSSTPNNTACPVDAINWDFIEDVAVIDRDRCIGCGICVVRCPVGAIHMQDTRATVNVPEPDAEIHTDKIRIGVMNPIVDTQPTMVETPTASPIFPDDMLAEMLQRVRLLPDSSKRILVRSILNSLGCRVDLSRQGDVNSRIDAVFETLDGCYGPLEMEFGADSLEALRSILDDVAVLSNRFGVEKGLQRPLIIITALPRERQAYWNVLSDVEQVVGMTVHTVTLSALFLVLWSGKKLDRASLASLSPDSASKSIREAIETLVGRPVNLTRGELGALEPEK